MTNDVQKIRQIFLGKSRYSVEAYQFVLKSMGCPKGRHVTGLELLSGIKAYGVEQYGFLAPQVFESWGVKETMDFGHIVFDLVELKVLRTTDEDSIDDFKDVYQFRIAFREEFLLSLDRY